MSDVEQDNRPLPIWRRIVNFLVFAAVVGVAVWFFFLRPQAGGVTAKDMMKIMGMSGPAGPMSVQALTVRPTTVPVTLEYLGQTEAFLKVDVRARVSGFLQKRLFEEGATVRQGQDLFRLEPDTFEADLAAADAAIEQAQAHCDQSLREVQRYKSLQAAGAATPKEVDDQQVNVRVFQADILAAKARKRQAQLNLDYTAISSPLTGIIGKVNRDVGSYISAQTDAALAVVQQVDPLYVEFPVTERDLMRWRELSGAKTDVAVELTLPDGQKHPHAGVVNFVDATVDNRTGTAMVRAKVPNPELLLRPGQLLRVRVTGLERKNILTVPQKAVIESSSGAMVYVVDDTGHAQCHPVTLGDWAGDQWIVEKGLEPGMRVIVDHLTSMKPNTEVKIAEAPGAPTTQPAAPKVAAKEGSVEHVR
jgi:membrane fusion protein (multidrug efflux system)